MSEDFESLMLDSIALSRRTRRGAAAAPTLSFVRDLDSGDRAELENPTPTGQAYGYNQMSGGGLKRLRHSHHLLAMVLAEGAERSRAAALTGYAPATISMLQLDPAFKELIAHYRTATMAEFEEIRARAASLGLSFLDEIQARLEDDPEGFSHKELRENAAMLLDRTILPSKGAGASATPAAPMAFNAQITFVSAAGGDAPPAPRMIEINPTERDER